MINYHNTTDASFIYRDTSAISTIRTDKTGDTGSLLQIMQDSIVMFGMPLQNTEGKVPSQTGGDLEAVFWR